MKNESLQTLNNKVYLYKESNGTISVEVKIENDTLWLTQKQMAELFGIDFKNVSWHLQNIFSDEGLNKKFSYLVLPDYCCRWQKL